MHALKIVFLVILTLALMRIVSLAFAWPLMRWWYGTCATTMYLVANAAGLLVFLGFLHWNRVPGEFLDVSASIFGVVVYALFAVLDCRWHPWRNAP